MRKALIATVLVALAFACGACVGRTGNSGSTDALATAQRKAYEKQAQARLKALDEQIVDFKRQALRQGAEARFSINQDIQNLSEKNANARAKLRQLENTDQPQEAWTGLKKGVNASIDDLQAACQRATAEMKEKSKAK